MTNQEKELKEDSKKPVKAGLSNFCGNSPSQIVGNPLIKGKAKLVMG